MAYLTYTKSPIGAFNEKEYGNPFEYSHNDDQTPWTDMKFNHKVWVGDMCNGYGFRYANVKKTVAYIAVDEDENGPVLEKWYIKNNRLYQS